MEEQVEGDVTSYYSDDAFRFPLCTFVALRRRPITKGAQRKPKSIALNSRKRFVTSHEQQGENEDPTSKSFGDGGAAW